MQCQNYYYVYSTTKINYYTILNSLDKIVSYTVMLTECNQFKYYKYVVGGGEDIKLLLTN